MQERRGRKQWVSQPKKPIKLAFGIIEPKTETPQIVDFTPQPQPFPMERVQLVGTLTLKDRLPKQVAPLTEELLARILNNLKKIYEEGKYANEKTSIDYEEGELLVSFPYNQGLVERIKGLDRNERAWDPDRKCWRIFPGAFDDVFDILGKGFRLTDAAYQSLIDFSKSSYYAVYAKGKFGKLISREHWFQEIDLDHECPMIPVQYQSNAFSKGEGPVAPMALSADEITQLIQNFAFRRQPFSHQLSGVEYILANPTCALLDEMGCGKSFQIASALGILLLNQTIDRVLIIAPMSLLRTWQAEIGMAVDVSYAIVSGTPKQRAKAFESGAQLLLVHYEGLRLEAEKLSSWLSQGKSALVFDESQRIKNLAAQTTKAAMTIREHAQRCIIATGTPIANRPLDLFSQYLVMDTGTTFGKKFSLFKNTFCIMETKKFSVGRKTIQKEVFIGVRNGPELRNRVIRTSLRRLKTDVLDLPTILYKDFVIDITAEQKQMYQQMRDNLKIEIASMSSSQVVTEAASIASRLLRLSQIASNPRLLDPNYAGKNAKMDELETLLEDILSDDTKKVIIWSHFVENVSMLTEQHAEQWGAVAHTGEMSPDERHVSVSRFQDDPTCRIFIATPQSAKEGLTLLPRDGVMKADTMIYVDLSFDSASYTQSQARFHRIGQTAERCLVIHLIGESTVDEYIRKSIISKIQEAKKILDDTTVTGLRPETQVITKAELLRILG